MKALRMEREPVRELGEQRYLPRINLKTVPPKIHSRDRNKSRPDNHRLIDGETVKALPPARVGFRRQSTRDSGLEWGLHDDNIHTMLHDMEILRKPG